MTKKIKKSALSKAIEMSGNASKFARLMGVSYPAVLKWIAKGYVPAERVVDAENASDGKITRQEFRPDLYL